MATRAAALPGPSRLPGFARWRGWAGKVLYVVILIAAWKLLVTGLRINPLLFPPPDKVFEEWLEFSNLILYSCAITLVAAVFGFVIATLVGIGLAVAVVYSPPLRAVILSSVVAINATPKVAVTPILVIWLGIGLESKIALAFLLSFFPVLINAVRGLSDIPNDLLNLYRLMQASPLQVFRKVRLPSALPGIFDGLKIALPISMIGAVAAEFVAARQGIGYQIVIAYANFNSEFVFAAVITIAILATLIFQALIIVEDRILFWRPSKQIF
jgi:NitT/TauT family transport system permease protein